MGERIMDKQIFKAIVMNNEEYYIKTLEDLIRTRPEIFYEAVLSAGGEIYVFDFYTLFLKEEYKVITKANLWFWKKDDHALRIKISVCINKSDLIEIVPYVLYNCTNTYITKWIEKKTNVHETKEGTWFDKLVQKSKEVEIKFLYEPSYHTNDTTPKNPEEFFGDILRRMQTEV